MAFAGCDAGGGAELLVLAATLAALGDELVLTVLAAVELVTLILMPVIATVIAAALASQDINGEEFELLKVTNLEGRTAFQGYFCAAVYRLRMPLVLAFAGLPSIAVIAVRAGEEMLWLIPVSVGLWGFSLASTAFAIEHTYWRHGLGGTIFLTVMVVGYLALIGGILGCCGAGILEFLLVYLIHGQVELVRISLSSSIIFALTPYWITAMSFQAKRRLP